MKCVLPVLGLILFCCSCHHEYTPEEKAIAENLVSNGKYYYDKYKGTPAEFASNKIGKLDKAKQVITGEAPFSYAEAVKRSVNCWNEIEKGANWDIPRKRVDIPSLNTVPIIDGEIKPGEWEDALVFDGEYKLNQKNPNPDYQESRWMIGWRGDYLYWAVSFQDEDLNIYTRTSEPGDTPAIYMGDSIEVFLRPQTDKLLYYELIINPAGKPWLLFHAINVWGGFNAFDRECSTAGLQVKTQKTSRGFTMECAIPMKLFYGPWCQNGPRKGDTFSFVMVRTNKDGERYAMSSLVPLLYGGHNAFGHILAKLN